MKNTQNPNQQFFDVHKIRERHCAAWLKTLHPQARQPIIAAILAGSTQGLLMIVQAGLLADILHQMIIEKQHWRHLQFLFAALVSVFLLRSLCVYFFQVWGFNAAARIKQKIRQVLLNKINHLGPGHGQQSGRLVTTLSEQCEAMDHYFSRYLPQQAIAVIVPVLIVSVVFPVNWLVAVIFLITGPLAPVFMVLIGMGAAAASRHQFLEMERMGGYFLNRLQGMTTLKLLGQAENELNRVRQISDRYREKTMAVLRIAFLSSSSLEFFSAVAVALVAVYVGLGLLGLVHFGPAENITLQQALFVLLLAPEFFLPLRQLAINYHDRAAALAAADSILTILEQEESVPPAKREPITPSLFCIEFKNVSKRYQQRTVLDHLNLRVKEKQKLVISGETGAGKTTLLNLLLGFEQASDGQVLIHGNSVTQDIACQKMAWMGRPATIFYGSIADNIRLFATDISMEAVTRVAEAAGVTAFSQILPKGLQTLIGEQGYGLSGGQIQRIVLARTLLKDSSIVLLDEPTAHLDNQTKQQLMTTMDRLFKEKTVIITSHDPWLINRTPQHLHLKNGRLQ